MQSYHLFLLLFIGIIITKIQCINDVYDQNNSILNCSLKCKLLSTSNCTNLISCFKLACKYWITPGTQLVMFKLNSAACNPINYNDIKSEHEFNGAFIYEQDTQCYSTGPLYQCSTINDCLKNICKVYDKYPENYVAITFVNTTLCDFE